ncbi:AMP-binding protein [Amycolatopsis sp. FU40]|uniref:AMP-binding protein n=1 Tax=Amycolatopsis sp. FU40 TaxID=2914159 RepID=UPI001F1DEBCE|nr:AMP-binding protein [Amycolatopsis sp. FU40]UKD58777.1 AMP-binding protein [Amycolatopsis sp. FU40]
METFAEVVRSRRGDAHEGLRFEGRSWTWAEVVDEAAVRASLLRTFEPGPGRTQRHVGVLLQNLPDFVFWILAAAVTGDVLVGVNSTRRGAELAADISHTDVDVLLTEPLYRDEAASLDLPTVRRILDVESAEYQSLLAEHAGADLPAWLPDPAAIFLLLFSSGSTGTPKAVICGNGRLGRLTDALAERVSLHRDSVTYLCLPMFHGHAIMMNLAAAAKVGATIVLVRKFSASQFVPDLRAHGVTYFNYVGRVLSYVVAQPEQPSDADNRLEVAFGSEAAPGESAEFRRRFGCEVREGYGSSEGGIRIVADPDAPPNALGRPAPGMRAEIRDQDNRECPLAEFDGNGLLLNGEEATGEIVAVGRGKTFEGYYRNPAAMAERLKFGGEDFWTGDLGYRDRDGYLYFAGRAADWLRVDGENFGTVAVERILGRYPAFAAAHCYGVPDPRTGDLLMASVILAEDAAFDPAEFAGFLAAQPDLGTKWRPTFVRIIDEAPVTGSGKVDKAPLRAQGWEGGRVWYAPSRASPYRLLTEEDREALRAEFAAHGRENSLPAASRR